MNVVDVLPRDAIPSIDEPRFGSAYFGEPDDEVIVVDGDPARAYPIRILSAHEIVNDAIDGDPIAVTWCPICWSGAVYDRRVDGRTLTFGVSGKLADDALVMYDRETDSEWKQPTGKAIAGPLEGTSLRARPAPMTTWERFRADHPDGVVLQAPRGDPDGDDAALRDVYDMAGYRRYVEGEQFGLYGMRGEGEPREWDRKDLDAKDVVLGIERNGDAVGVPRARVEAGGGQLRVDVGGREVLVVAGDGGLHAYEAPATNVEFRDGRLVAGERSWEPVTGESADGPDLERVPATQLFAFAWQDAHGRDAFLSP